MQNFLLDARWDIPCKNDWEGMRMPGGGFPFLSTYDCNEYCGTSGGMYTVGWNLVLNCVIMFAASFLLWYFFRKKLEQLLASRFSWIYVVWVVFISAPSLLFLFFALAFNSDNSWIWNSQPPFDGCTPHMHLYLFMLFRVF
ncbi:MAG TPA: hypothetical protein VFU15_04455 [Bacteroidia bacterium]|nr:hypothetical protein [Bacteroidia bacterium]